MQPQWRYFKRGLLRKKIPWWLMGNISPANCVAAYQPKDAATYELSKINLANPGTYDLTNGTAYPAWERLLGWVFDGTLNQYLRTGIVPAMDQTWSMVLRMKPTGATAFRFASVVLDATNTYGFGCGIHGTNCILMNPVLSLIPTDPIARDLVMGFAGPRSYAPDVATLTANLGAASVTTENELFIGAGNSGGSPLNPTTCEIKGLAVYNTVLTDKQFLAVKDAMRMI